MNKKLVLMCIIAALLSLCTTPNQPNQPTTTTVQSTTLTTPTAAPATKVIFEEDFEAYRVGGEPEDFSLVRVVGGSPNNFTVVEFDSNRVLMIQLRGYRQITDVLVITKKVENFTLKFDLHESKPYDATPALVFGFSDHEYYLITYNEYAEKAGVVKLYNVIDGEPNLLSESSAPIKTLQDGMWHSFNLTLRGNLITAKIDGFEIISASVDKRKGYVGFANSDGSLGRYLIDNILLKGE